MARVLILTGSHLWRTPRPLKEADALAAAGHDVTVAGIWFDREYIEWDRALAAQKPWRFVPVLDLSGRTLTSRVRSLMVRGARRCSRALFKRFGVIRPSVLGYAPRHMLSFCRSHNADLTIVHSQLGMMIGAALQDEGRLVGVDFEDWFSEDVWIDALPFTPIPLLQSLERQMMQRCRYKITTSEALATALAETYETSRPEVCYNVFPYSGREMIDGRRLDRQSSSRPSIFWFSQTLGPGRGHEVLLRALKNITLDAELHFRGAHSESYRAHLLASLPAGWRDRTFFHQPVPSQELLSRIAEHDIGLALETTERKNFNLTITNKFFQYLLAPTAVIATPTAGQREIFSRTPEIGTLLPSWEPEALQQALEELLGNPELLAQKKAAALEAARRYYCSEEQMHRYQALAGAALAEGPSTGAGR